MGFILVDLIHVNEVKETAVIRLIEDDNQQVGVNLWEIFGYTRNSDQFTDWKYAVTGE